MLRRVQFEAASAKDGQHGKAFWALRWRLISIMSIGIPQHLPHFYR